MKKINRHDAVDASALFKFPSNYPDVFEQMGQEIGRVLKKNGHEHDVAGAIAYECLERIRTAVGGITLYIPRGQSYELSLRDEEIYKKFNGRNYVELGQEFDLCEVRVRTLVKQGQLRDRAKRQKSMFD